MSQYHVTDKLNSIIHTTNISKHINIIILDNNDDGGNDDDVSGVGREAGNYNFFFLPFEGINKQAREGN